MGGTKKQKNKINMEIIQEFGKIAGIAGLGLGVFLFLFKDLIAKSIFPNMTQEQGYKIIRLFMFLVWSIAIIGIFSWLFIEYRSKADIQTVQPNEVLPSNDIKTSKPVEESSKENAQLPQATQKSPKANNAEKNKPALIDNRGGTISKSPIIPGEKAEVKIEYNDKDQ